MRTTLIIIILATCIGGGGAFVWRYYGGFVGEQAAAVTFINVYGDYAEIADRVELLVHMPGTEGNVDRAELLALLEAMLTQDMEHERRETLARLAFANLDSLKQEVDAAQVAQATLYEVLQDLDNASRVFRSIERRDQAALIVGMARKRAEHTARITSVLSDTQAQTYAIITQILADNGALTSDHIRSINEATTKAEERFQSLVGLYEELLQEKQRLDAAFSTFAADAI